MSGTHEGAMKMKQTVEAKYGKDYWSKIGKLGGAAGKGHAFGHGKVNPSEAGRIGGKKSKRTKTLEVHYEVQPKPKIKWLRWLK